MTVSSRPPLRVLVLGALAALAPLAAAQQPSTPPAKPATPPAAKPAAPAAQAAPAAPATPATAKPGADAGPLKQDQLEQMLAPLALYPDDLLSQILMASTYPLEIVLADRWAKAHKGSTGDAAAKLLEKETWDASVKSLIAAPDVLAMLSDKLDWTQKVGDAFISQQQDVMTAIQTLRKKAQETGNLKSDDKQTVQASGSTIVIQSADPEIIYVPVYDTTVVYGSWPYPYYPPGYHYGAGVGIAIGFAWGYAWGHCDWNGGDVDIDIDRNVNRNRNIDRDAAKQKLGERGQGGKGKWQHDPGHRGGLPYKDNATAKKFGGVTGKEAAQSRDAFRGKTDPLGSKGAGVADRAGTSGSRSPSAPSASNRAAPSSGNKSPSSSSRDQRGTNSGAFDGANRSKGQTQKDSSRGKSSRSSGGSSRGGSRGGRGGGGRGR